MVPPTRPDVTLSSDPGVETRIWLGNLDISWKWKTSSLVTIEAMPTGPEETNALKLTDQLVRHATLKGTNSSQLEGMASS